MAEAVDDEYLKKVIALGDEGSALLAAVCAPTLKAHSHVKIIGPDKRVALEIPADYRVFVHSAAGYHREGCESEETAQSLVNNLYEQAAGIHAMPIAMTNIIDSATGDTGLLRRIAEAMAEEAMHYRVAIINGENAILGDVVNGFNISGTMISVAPIGAKVDGKFLPESGEGILELDKDKYAHFTPEGKYVIANSDGIGTKTRFYQRARVWTPSLNDFLAMILDDGAKVRGARVKVASGVIETNEFPGESSQCQLEMQKRCASMGILGTLQKAPGRLNAYKKGEAAYNIGGTAVSVVSEEDLLNPLVPAPGDYVIAIRGKPNPRSNGITDKRKRMIQLFGENWHETEIGKIFLRYLAEPSTVLYPVFSELVESGIATGVFHMSGGAYNGKFARPLAKVNRFAQIADLFPPDWREVTLIGAAFTPAKVAYGKFPMGNEGFVTTSSPVKASQRIEMRGLQARVVGRVYDSKDTGKTGLELDAFNGEKIYFMGKD